MTRRNVGKRLFDDISIVSAAVCLVILGAVIGIAAYHNFWVVAPEGAEHYQDNFEILPKEDHNVHAIEAYGTLIVAIVSAAIAALIWRSVRIETQALQSHAELVEANLELVSANTELVAASLKATRTSAIQTISFEMLKIDRWMADHPSYAEAIVLPEDNESVTGTAVAEVYADFIDTVICQEDLLPADHMDAWIDYFHDIYTMWPQLRKYMKAHPDWYLEDQNRLFEGRD